MTTLVLPHVLVDVFINGAQTNEGETLFTSSGLFSALCISGTWGADVLADVLRAYPTDDATNALMAAGRFADGRTLMDVALAQEENDFFIPSVARLVARGVTSTSNPAALARVQQCG